MRKVFTFLAAALMCVSAMASTRFEFSSESDMTQTIDGITVTLAKGSGSNNPAWYTNGMRLYASNTITVTANGITGISARFAKQGSKPYAPLTVNVGTLVSGGESTGSDNAVTDTWTGDASQVVFALGTGQRIIVDLEVTLGGQSQGGEGGGGSQGGGDTPTGLDPTYSYQEPTVVTPAGTEGSNQNYTFIVNNVQVSCTQGAVYTTTATAAEYFGCNAGQTLTFTTTRAMKAIVVNGYVKKDFSATVSAGQVEYVDASEAEVEADPVLVIKDINATNVALTCAKQMRCYSVEVYFVSNPDVEIGEDGDDGDYSYEWESTEVTTLNLTFDVIDTGDMSEDLGYACSFIGLYSDEYEMELDVFAALQENGMPAVGRYPINDSYTAGTVMASPGGDDYMDYPSMLLSDFYEEDGEWYYNTVYYLVGGTLEIAAVQGGVELRLNATTYYGSTVRTTFLVESEATGVRNAEQAVRAVKTIENGQLFIRRGDKKFTVMGVEL